MVYMTDSLRKNPARTGKTCDGELTRKELIASFPGTSFVAERDAASGALNVYLISGDGIEANALMDRAAPGGMTPAKMQLKNEASRRAGRFA